MKTCYMCGDEKETVKNYYFITEQGPERQDNFFCNECFNDLEEDTKKCFELASLYKMDSEGYLSRKK